MKTSQTVLAAGAIVWRKGSATTEVVLVHRPKHDDWTFPKGKLDRGERLPTAAVREVLEETSVPIRLGVPLPTVSYPVTTPRSATKQVSYWIARPIDDGAITLDPNHEIDEVRWVDLADAPDQLTYDHDRSLLDRFVRMREHDAHRTWPLVVLRHATARSRTRWKGDDTRRTLTAKGLREAHRLVPLLAAFGVTDVVSSDSARCVQTIEPYADHLDADIVLDAGLTEERASPKRIVRRLRELTAVKRAAVLCTHRPVLPLVFDALGIPPTPLEPGELLVAHRRGGTVLGTELHRP